MNISSIPESDVLWHLSLTEAILADRKTKNLRVMGDKIKFECQQLDVLDFSSQ